MASKIKAAADNRISTWGAMPGLTGVTNLMAVERGLADILVAVIDGPVHGGHAAFADTQFVDGDDAQASPAPRSDHGTHITSIIVGSNGIAPDCRVMTLPVYAEDGSGELVACSQADLAMAIDKAVTAGAHIINISGGIVSRSGRAEAHLEEAIKRCVRNNVLVVAAAGNDGCDCVHVPASLPGVLAVGAAGHDGAPLDFSNFGTDFRDNGILAPGQNIPGAVPAGGSAYKTGTSFATPIVSGVAALLLSQHVRTTGRPDPLAIKDILLGCAVGRLSDEAFEENRALKGRLNVPCAHIKTLAAKGAQDVLQPSSLINKDPSMSENSSISAPITASSVDHDDLQDVIDMAISHSEAPAQASAPVPAAPASAVPAAPAARSVPSAFVQPSDCGCKPIAPSVASGQLVFALGQLSYDFGSEARMDYFIQQMGGAADIMNPVKMATRLQEADKGGDGHTDEAEALIWTLNIDDTPVYAIEPDSQFAVLAYLRLVEFLFQQEKQGVERVSIAGRVKGTTRLYNGTVVPSISPTLRGMYNWNVDTLVDAVLETVDDLQGDAQTKVRGRIGEFLNRIYYEMRNPGMTAENRAMNFAATNAFHTGPVFKEMAGQDMVLDRIRVERSPICRPDSDCWDVVIVFFNPARIMDQARKVYRITVDVSDTVPVTVGDTRSWFVYFGQN